MARPAVDSKRIANSESKTRMDLTRKGRFRKVAEPIATGNCDTSDGHARPSSVVCFSPVAQAQPIGYRRWALDPKATNRAQRARQRAIGEPRPTPVPVANNQAHELTTNRYKIQ